MIKKIICLLLIITCSISLFACGNDGDDQDTADIGGPNLPDDGSVEEPGENPADEVPGDKEFVEDTDDQKLPDQEFFLLIASSMPNVIKTKSYVLDNSTNIAYEGMYTTVIRDDGVYEFEYDYEKARELTSDSAGLGQKEEFSGKVYYWEGMYSTDAENWTVKTPNVDILDVKLDLDREYLGAYRMSKDGKTLTADKISAENAEKILGVDINTDGSVKITVTSNGTYLWKVTVEYSNANASVRLETSYTYE